MLRAGHSQHDTPGSGRQEEGKANQARMTSSAGSPAHGVSAGTLGIVPTDRKLDFRRSAPSLKKNPSAAGDISIKPTRNATTSKEVQSPPSKWQTDDTKPAQGPPPISRENIENLNLSDLTEEIERIQKNLASYRVQANRTIELEAQIIDLEKERSRLQNTMNELQAVNRTYRELDSRFSAYISAFVQDASLVIARSSDMDTKEFVRTWQKTFQECMKYSSSC